MRPIIRWRSEENFAFTLMSAAESRVSSLKFKFASVLGRHFSDDSSRQTNRQSHNLIVQNPIRSKKKIKENTVARGEMYNYDVR